jgi:hypothetical protein
MLFNRREMLQIGCSSALGLTLPAVLAGRSAAAPTSRRVRSVVLVFLTGGASHIDSFDPKPEGGEIRGEFTTIDTRIPGVQFTEHLPRLAARADQLAIVRSMAHNDNRHLSATHNTLTGATQPFRGPSDEDIVLSRGDWPCYGATLNYLRPADDGTPSHVTLPHPLIEGHLTWPGQHAGFLGPQYDPFQLNDDPSKDSFRVTGLSLPNGLSVQRLGSRKQLLRRLNDGRHTLDDWAARQQFRGQQEAAYRMLTSSDMARAFHLHQEPDSVREKYGRQPLGQTLLLARRLVEAGVPVIQCNMGIVQSWDTHVDNFGRLKNTLLPGVDQGVSGLLDDLQQRGLLDETLVVCVGEFGRTPRISLLPNATIPGRDHWAWAYSAVFAGAGVVGGQVIGETDRIGAYPTSTPYHPNDLGATIYGLLGVDLETVLRDKQDRAIPLNRGRTMDVLFSGASA